MGGFMMLSMTIAAALFWTARHNPMAHAHHCEHHGGTSHTGRAHMHHHHH